MAPSTRLAPEAVSGVSGRRRWLPQRPSLSRAHLVGAGLGFMPLTVAMLSEVAPEHAGTASGLLQMGQQVGGSLGLAVLVTVFASSETPGDLVSGMPAAFLAGGGFVLAAVVLAGFLLGRQGRVAEEPAVELQQDDFEPAA